MGSAHRQGGLRAHQIIKALSHQYQQQGRGKRPKGEAKKLKAVDSTARLYEGITLSGFLAESSGE